MPIKLKCDEGYFSRKVSYEGTTFSIRELDDEAEEGLKKLEAQLKEDAEKTLQEHGIDPAALRAKLAQIPPGDIEAIGVAMEECGGELPLDVEFEFKNRRKAILVFTCQHGVVGWDITGHECTPENVEQLPNWVLKALSKEIIKDTVLSDSDAAFLAAPQ